MVHIYLKLKPDYITSWFLYTQSVKKLIDLLDCSLTEELNKTYMFKTVHGNDGKHTVNADFKQVLQTVFKDIFSKIYSRISINQRIFN